MSRLYEALQALNQAVDSGYKFSEAIDLVLERYDDISQEELTEAYENQ